MHGRRCRSNENVPKSGGEGGPVQAALPAVADPEVLVLFESWREELESEVIAFIKKTNSLDPMDLVEGLGLSRSGADFLVTKLKREGML